MDLDPPQKQDIKRYVLTRGPGPEQVFTGENLVRVRYGVILSRTKTSCVNTTLATKKPSTRYEYV